MLLVQWLIYIDGHYYPRVFFADSNKNIVPEFNNEEYSPTNMYYYYDIQSLYIQMTEFLEYNRENVIENQIEVGGRPTRYHEEEEL